MKPNMLRIAHINTERTWRGGEQQVLSLAIRLARRGHENLIVARKGGALARRSKEAGIETHEISPMGEWDFLSALMLARRLKSSGVNVVHAHAPHATAFAAFCTRFSGLPAISTRRVDFHLKKSVLTRWKYARMSRVIAISDAIKEILIEDGIPPERIAVVRSGIDFERLEKLTPKPRSELGISSGEVLVGQLAALAPHKDQTTFLRAISFLKWRIPKLRAAIVGDGPLKSRLKTISKNLGIYDIVTFYGFREDALSYCKAFDYFCLSSKEEGLGTAIIDAMAMKIPVIATDAGGIPELVTNKKTGYLARVGNPSSLADAIEEAVNDSKYRGTIIENAYRKALEFNIDSTVAGMEAIYQEVISQ